MVPRCSQRTPAPGSAVLPLGGTDNKALNGLGITGYGFAPLRLPADLDFAPMFHGIDERVPVDSLEFGARVLQRLSPAAERYAAWPATRHTHAFSSRRVTCQPWPSFSGQQDSRPGRRPEMSVTRGGAWRPAAWRPWGLRQPWWAQPLGRRAGLASLTLWRA
jgi:hypothetical protein